MLLVAGAFLAVLVAGELVHRVFGVGPELSRKLDHAAAGPIALALPLVFDSAWPVLVLTAGFLAVIVVTRRAGLLRSVHGIPRSSAGAYLYPVAVGVTFVLAEGRPDRYAVAIAAFAFADAAGGLVGGRWSRGAYTSWGRAKSLEGSGAVCLVTAIAAFAVLAASGVPPMSAARTAAYVGAVVALVEGALPWGLDNLGVPLAALAALGVAGSPVAAALLFLGAVALFGVSARRPSRVRTAGPGTLGAAGPATKAAAVAPDGG
jgi:phytol kinase